MPPKKKKPKGDLVPIKMEPGSSCLSQAFAKGSIPQAGSPQEASPVSAIVDPPQKASPVSAVVDATQEASPVSPTVPPSEAACGEAIVLQHPAEVRHPPLVL